MEVELQVEGRPFTVTLHAEEDGSWSAQVGDARYPVARRPDGTIAVGDRHVRVEDIRDDAAAVDGVRTPFRIEALHGVAGAGGAAGGGAAQVRAPMTGRLVRIQVAVGDAVAKGDVLFILEAMKMQNEVRSPVAGTVAAVHGAEGETLEPQSVVVRIEA